METFEIPKPVDIENWTQVRKFQCHSFYDEECILMNDCVQNDATVNVEYLLTGSIGCIVFMVYQPYVGCLKPKLVFAL